MEKELQELVTKITNICNYMDAILMNSVRRNTPFMHRSEMKKQSS